MTDSYNGLAFTVAPRRVAARSINVAARGINVAARGIHVRGGRPRRQLLVIAKDVHRATEIARSMVLHAIFAEAGPEVLARARKLGIRDNDAGIDEGQAS
jgi:hypothetical protein